MCNQYSDMIRASITVSILCLDASICITVSISVFVSVYRYITPPSTTSTTTKDSGEDSGKDSNAFVGLWESRNLNMYTYTCS